MNEIKVPHYRLYIDVAGDHTYNGQVYNVVKDKYNRNMRTGRISGYGEVFI